MEKSSQNPMALMGAFLKNLLGKSERVLGEYPMTFSGITAIILTVVSTRTISKVLRRKP